MSKRAAPRASATSQCPRVHSSYAAADTYLRVDKQPARMWMASVDTRSGNGTLHMQSRGLNGRKFFAWGREPSSQNRYYYLSSCEPPAGKCHGEYFEMCAWK